MERVGGRVCMRVCESIVDLRVLLSFVVIVIHIMQSNR